MPLPDRISYDAHIFSHTGISPVAVELSAEYSVIIKINGRPFVSIACSGSGLDSLAVGHLITEGVVRSENEIVSVKVDESEKSVDVETVKNDDMIDRLFKIRSLASACGQGKSSIGDDTLAEVNSNGSVSGKLIINCMKIFLHLSDLHKDTRGVHSAALYDFSGNKILFVDEIGRHNAVDKIIGICYMNNIDLSDKMIFSTGRLSSEIVYKALYGKTPVLVSKAYPTSLSIDIARKYNLTIAANVSASKFFIFSGNNRITE
jgi:FdhD protein